MILIGSNGPSSTLRIGDVRSKESADTKPVNSPLDIMKSIYSSNDQNEIMKYFNNANQYINDNPSLFRQTLDNIFSMNDHVDLLEISKKNSLTPQDKMEIAIRTYSRCILKMKEMNSSNANIQDMLNKTNDLMASNRSYDKLYQISGYFMCNLYDTMAKKCPVRLQSMIENRQIDDPAGAALALLRSGHDIGQKKIFELARSNLSLVYYLNDPNQKTQLLLDMFSGVQQDKYNNRCWQQRDIINALASYPEGKQELGKMRGQGLINYVEVDGIIYGSLNGSGISEEKIQQYMDKYKAVSYLVQKSNERFGSREKIFYIDITPEKDDQGSEMNGAGWAENALFMSIKTVDRDSIRAVSFSMLHEACEQKSVKGKLTSDLGMTYIDAISEGRYGALESLRLGSRIGGNYVDSGLGHPWDSEREWLAETASAVIIGEPLQSRATPALNAANKILN